MFHLRTIMTTAIIGLMIMVTLPLAGCSSGAPIQSTVNKPSTTTPFTDITIVGKSELKPGEETTLICAATDATGSQLNYIWTTEGGTITGEGKTIVWKAPDTEGEYEVRVRVINGKGEEQTLSRKFKVTQDPYHNNTPDKTIYLNLTIPSTEVVKRSSKIRILNTAEIQCIVTGADADSITYKWSAPAGKLFGESINLGKASKIGWIAPGQAESYTVSVEATDRDGRQARGEVVFEVFCCKEPQ